MTQATAAASPSVTPIGATGAILTVKAVYVVRSKAPSPSSTVLVAYVLIGSVWVGW